MLVNEDDLNDNPNLISFDINRYLADPKNTLAGDNPNEWFYIYNFLHQI